jgi:hypothetical protein
MARKAKYEARGDAIYLGKDCIALLDTDVSPKAVNEARARLFAAAPELLMALQMSLPALEWCQQQWALSPQQGEGVNVLNVVRAALANAEAR